MNRATRGSWFVDVSQVPRGVKCTIYTEARLNKLADLGYWYDGSTVEGIANAVMMANSKNMHQLLTMVQKYGNDAPQWLMEDVNHLLGELTRLADRLEKEYEDSHNN